MKLLADFQIINRSTCLKRFIIIKKKVLTSALIIRNTGKIKCQMEHGTYTVTSLKKCINYSKPGLFLKIMWEGFISVIYIYMVSKSQRDDTC